MHAGLDIRLNLVDDRDYLLKYFLKLVLIKRETQRDIEEGIRQEIWTLLSIN